MPEPRSTTPTQREAVARKLYEDSTGCPWLHAGSHRKRFYQQADEIIAVYEAAAWEKAEDAPLSWAGKRGFSWAPGANVVATTIPGDHSRNPRHCGGVMFRLWPDPPKDPDHA
jgi:hypothetical protein